MKNFKPGDHIKTDCGAYWHHGIVETDTTVIHLSGVNAGKDRASVRQGALADFDAGSGISVVEYGVRHDPETTVARARAHLGRSGYDLAFDNCEHFARDCATGTPRSLQVEAAAGKIGTVALMVTTPTLATNTVAALGAVKGVSAPGVMSALAQLGGGTGAIGGIATLAAVPATATAAVVAHTVFRDDPHATADEREARQAARLGAWLGVPAATIGTILLVSRLGVKGLGANGITSGLKALGAVLGRPGLLRGLLFVAGISIATVLAFALCAYWVKKAAARGRELERAAGPALNGARSG